MIPLTKRAGAALLLPLLAGACRVGPDYERPDTTARTAAAWRTPATGAPGPRRMELARWWERFGSEELTGLAERLVVENLSLAEARQRLVTARARRGLVAAGDRPEARGEAAVVRAGTGERSLNFQGPPPGQDVDVHSVGASAAWELDLWGRVARLTEAADADVEVALEDYRDAAVSLLAELALAYVDATTLRERLGLHERELEVLRRTEGLARSRLGAGSGPRLAVAEARRELDTARARGPSLRGELRAAESRIAVLVGERPRDGLVSASAPLRLPGELGVGLPADLLERRADVRRAEGRLAAATALVGAAEARRYPTVALHGTLALRARELGTLTDGADALAYSVGPELSVPLFTGGRIDAEVRARESETEAARLRFERVLLESIAEVEDAADGVARARERHARLEDAAAAARMAARLAAELHDAGLRGLGEALAAERAAVAAEEARLSARRGLLERTVALYRALGGGFEAIGTDGALREPPARAEQEPGSVKRVVVLVVVLALGAAGGVLGYRRLEARAREDAAGALRLHGNVELRDAQLAFPSPERVASVLVEEGDRVAAGQLLATQRTERLDAELAAAEARVRAQQALVDELEHGTRAEEVAQARAVRDAARVRADNAERVIARMRTTVESGATSAQELDDAEAALAVAQAELEARAQALALAEAGPRAEERARAAATLDALRGDVAVLRRRRTDSELRAPCAGVVRSRILEPGEAASAERPVLTLALTDAKWVRAFVPEPQLGRVASGMRAVVRSDSFGGREYEGWVGFVSPMAEFTPKAVETTELRTQLVYEVRVRVPDPRDELRMGMPVTVEVDTEGGTDHAPAAGEEPATEGGR